MNRLEEEIEKIRYELAVNIPEELRNATDSTESTETGEYSEILTRQNLLSIRLSQLINRLNVNTHVDLKNIPRDKIGMGSLVKLHCKASHDEFYVKIISSEISDIIDESYNEITINSPIGKALYNKRIGEETRVITPSGTKEYIIIELTTIHDLKNTT